jgi:Kef-type K+ transport system membrane component KefB
MTGHLIADIGKSVIAAGSVGFVAQFLGVPLILSYLFAGIVIGPIGLGLIQDAGSIRGISEIGLIFLMFILGLEINVKKLLQTGKAVFLTGVVQIAVCSLMAFGLFSVFNFDLGKYGLVYLAVACALSSTLIVVKILSDQMDLDSLPSRITLGILVLQDLFAIGFMAVQPNLSDLKASALALSFFKVLILVVVSWLLAKYVLPRVFKAAGRMPELMLILAMSWCFAICGVANYLSLSVEMGALVAGVSIASFPYHLDIAAKISSLRDFFITLFFVSLGLQIPIPTIEVVKIASVIFVFVMLSRILTIYPVLHKLGYANRASLLVAVNLSQISEFSLVLAAIGVAYQHISPALLSSFILALVASALISSLLIPRAHSFYLLLNSTLQKLGFHDHVTQGANEQDLKNNSGKAGIVILGFYREASSLLVEMQKRYSPERLEEIMVIDFNPEAHKELKRQGILSHYGDVSNVDMLRALNLTSARFIVCSIPDKTLKGTTNLKLLGALKQLAPESGIIVTAESVESAREMYRLGASYVILPRVIGAHYIIDILDRLQVNGADSIRDEAMKYLANREEIIR